MLEHVVERPAANPKLIEAVLSHHQSRVAGAC